jgi:hypothetical protein
LIVPALPAAGANSSSAATPKLTGVLRDAENIVTSSIVGGYVDGTIVRHEHPFAFAEAVTVRLNAGHGGVYRY